MIDLDFVLIPGGEFIIGSRSQEDGEAGADEKPQHRLDVSDFYIMRYPVTNTQYARFVEAAHYRAPLFWPKSGFPQDLADHPVVGVNLLDAAAFCKWASIETGRTLRLPTEPEWEKAARGMDGRIFPWGNRWDAGLCNSSEARLGGTSRVGAYSPQGDSPFGVGEMGGNVQEWVLSLYRPYPYDPEDGREVLLSEFDQLSALPRSHEMGATSIPSSLEAALDKSMLRGGSWREGRFRSRCAYRSWAAPMHRSDDTGFRCCFEAV